MNRRRPLGPFFSILVAVALATGGTLAVAQTPPNDNLANATVLTGTNVTVAATTVGATAESGEPAHAGSNAVHSIWFVWTAPNDGSTLIDLSGSAYGTHLAVYVGKYLASLTLVSSNAFGNPDGTAKSVFRVAAGVLYDFAVDVSGSPGPVELSLQFTRSYFPPQITQQPSGESVLQGGTASFSVVATSDSPISYQWLDNQGNNITGATNSVLALTNVAPSQAGAYQAVVSNAGGSIVSSNAVLVVNLRPPNDDFANRILLSGNAAATAGSDIFATAENGEPSAAGWPSPQSVWWTWTAPATGLAFVEVTNFVGNQVLAIYTGASLAQLTPLASGSWFAGPLRVQFEVSGGTSYQITVAGVGGTGGAFQLDLSFIATNFPPIITQQPASQTVQQGATVTFQVVASSGLPLNFQWQFNGSPITGATNASLVLSNVVANQAGAYLVVVSNAGGSAPSAVANLVVNVPPSNDNFANASLLSGLDVTTTGNNQFATSEPDEPAHGGYPPGASVWWTWTTPSIGEAYVDVTGFSGAETLGVYTGSVLSNLTTVVSSAWAAGPVSVHFAAMTPGTTFRIAVADPNGNGGAFQLHAKLSISNFPPIAVSQPPSQTNVIPGQVVTFQFGVQSDFPVTNQWFFNGTPINGGSLTGGGGGGGGGGGAGGGGGGNYTGTLELDNVTTNQAGIYQVVTTSYGGSVTSNPVTLVMNFPPSNDNFTNRITLSGVNLTTSGTTRYATLESGEPAYAGLTSGGSVWWSWTAPAAGTASLSVVGTNAAAQILQVFTGGNLTKLVAVAQSGPGPSSLSASFVTTVGTVYQIAVVGGDSSFQLGLQFLSAAVPPQITQQPVGVTVPLGGSASFQVGAVGGGVLAYQWQFNGTNLSGATNSTLALANVQTNQNGPYQVIVSNPGGSVTSVVALLAVTLRPSNDDFANRIVLAGANVSTLGSDQYATSEPFEPIHAGWGPGKSVWWSWTAPSDGRLQLRATNYSGNQVMAVYTGNSLAGLSAVASSTWIQVPPMVALFNVTSGTTYQIAVAGVSGLGGSFELDLAFTVVVFPPVITQQPFNLVVKEGGCVTNQVVATGTPPLSYQWQLNGANLPNATNAVLGFCNVKTNQAGVYQVIVSNPGGSVPSTTSSLVVNARPPNDDFANRIPLADQVVVTSGSNRFATSEPNEPAHAGYGPFASVWWSYTPPLTGVVTVNLTNSFYGALLAVYTGAGLTQLSLVASNSFGNADGTARVSFLGLAGTTYQIAVQGVSDTSGNIVLSVTGDFPPTIITQPQDLAVAAGEDAEFGVTAQSQSPLSYQWLFGGVNIPNATNQVLLVSSVNTYDLGLYSVRVQNDIGSVTSRGAALSLTTVLTGQVTDATTGDPLPGVLVWAGSITNVTDTNGNYRLTGVQATNLRADFNASVQSGLAPLAVQFFDQSTLNSAVLQAETNGYFSYTNSAIQLYQNQSVTNSFSLSPILAAGTMRLVLNWGAQPRDLDANLLTPLIQGQAYHVYYQTGSRGNLTNVPFAALNVDRTNGFGPETVTVAQFFTGTYAYYVHKYAGAGPIAGSGAIVKIYTDAGLGQTVLAPTTGVGDFWMVCTIDGATREVTIANQILTSQPTNQALVLVEASNPDAPATLRSRRPLDLTPGTAAFLWGFGDGTSSALEDPVHVYTNPGLYSVTLTVTTSNNIVQSDTKTNFIQVLAATNQPPSIATQPANATVIEGTTASFQVAANGFGALSYQWFFNRTNPLVGATGPTLSLANAQPANAGGYSVVVTNSAGAVTSVVATLTVLVPPNIATQPANATVVAGTTATFQVAANGSGALSYQWFFNRTNRLVGGTAATLTLANAQPANAGGYSVVVTNLAGSATSVVATLTVLVPPSIAMQPTNETVIAGTTATFQVAANGSGAPSYQWFFNQTNRLVGATAATMTLANAQPANAGGYSVVVTNLAGSATSVVATLTVLVPPSIAMQPTNETVIAGTTATFQVAANGSGALSYQWFFNQTNRLVGATAATMTLANAQPANAGGYSVVVTNLAGGVTSTVARLTVLVPPTISISAPTDGAAFPSGTNIAISATATDANGPVTNVTFYANGTTQLGLVTNLPYRILWSNVPTGLFALTAVAIDNYGLSSTSAVVNITVSAGTVNQAPSFLKGPDITIIQNSGPQTFANWATAISAGPPSEASQTLTFTTTSDNPGLFSIQPALSSKGTLTFTPASNASGGATVTVVLRDNGGTANGGHDTSAPQTFTITVAEPRDVAIILASTEVDPGPLTNAVATVSLPGEQSLTWEIFQRSELSFAVLSFYKLVIWYDPLGTQQVAQAEVSLLQNLYSNGIPLIFVGPQLVSSGAGLPPQLQAAWEELLHLQGHASPPLSGTVVPAQSTSGTLLPNGTYGQITPFNITTPVDQATVTSDADSDGQLGTNDVLVSFPSASNVNPNRVRTFTQLMLLQGDGDAQSVGLRNEVLQNAICWVLNCGVCPEIYPSFQFAVAPQIPQTGAFATLTFTLGNNGECDGAAYLSTVQLSAGLNLVSANADYGQLTTSNNVMYLYIGRIPARQQLNLTIVVIPVIPGWVTNLVHIQAAAITAQDSQATFEVQGNRIPEMGIARSGANSVLLSAWAQPGLSYVLERATLHPLGPSFLWTTVTNFVFAAPVFQLQDTMSATNSVFLYRVRTGP